MDTPETAPQSSDLLLVLGEMYRQQIVACLQQMATTSHQSLNSTSPNPSTTQALSLPWNPLLPPCNDSQPVSLPIQSPDEMEHESNTRRDISSPINSSPSTKSTSTDHVFPHNSTTSPLAQITPIIVECRNSSSFSVVPLLSQSRSPKRSRTSTSIADSSIISNEFSPDKSLMIHKQCPSPTNDSTISSSVKSKSLSTPASRGEKHISNNYGLSNERKNYKNLNPGRRKQANARERDRVQNIGRAFDQLRETIPAYSHQGTQKLSKLAVLRIACSYIRCLTEYVSMPDETLEKIHSHQYNGHSTNLSTHNSDDNQTMEDSHAFDASSSQSSPVLNFSSPSEEDGMESCDASNSQDKNLLDDLAWLRFQRSALELGQRIREESKQRMSL